MKIFRDLKILKQIDQRCDLCQHTNPAPTRFWFNFGTEKARLDERVMIDIMSIYSKPVLRIVDESTKTIRCALSLECIN